MATAEETAAVREIARRRWLELERKLARQGADSPPEETLEAEDLRRKWNFALSVDVLRATPPSIPTSAEQRQLQTIEREIEWLRGLIASALRSNQDIKRQQELAATERHRRDWIVYVAIGVLILIEIPVALGVAILLSRFGGW